MTTPVCTGCEPIGTGYICQPRPLCPLSRAVSDEQHVSGIRGTPAGNESGERR
jgi:hypothetical protein